jgi:hypothetical protein
MDYLKLVELIPTEKWGVVSDQLTNYVLTTKNVEKMPSALASCMLIAMKSGIANSKSGVSVLLEAALLLEPEKTLGALNEMQLSNVVEQIKQSTS